MADREKISQASAQVAYQEPGKVIVSEIAVQVAYAGISNPPRIAVSEIAVQVAYVPTPEGPLMAQLMRHGTWFSSGGKQPMWWAK